MRQISTDTWSVDDIVQGELVDEGAELEKQGQRLCTIQIVSTSCLSIIVLIFKKQTDLSNATSGASNNCMQKKVSSNAMCDRRRLIVEGFPIAYRP